MEWIEIIIEALVSFAAVAAAVWIIYFGLNRYFAA